MALVMASTATDLGTGNAQETVTVRGSVDNGTGGGAVPVELAVLMLVSDPAGRPVSSAQAATGDAGRFRFDQVPLLEGGRYALRVEYAGVSYDAALAPEDLSGEVRLTVYETTPDVSVVRVARQALVITDVAAKHREIEAFEIVILSNSSDRTLLPDVATQGTAGSLRFSLPPQAGDVSVMSDLPGGEILPTGDGFAITFPVVPGEHLFEFSFRFPYQGDQTSYRQTLPQGAHVYQVLVPDRLASIGVAPLQPIPPVDLEGSSYRAWEGRDFQPGQGMVLELTDLPQPGLAARVTTSLADDAFWKLAIPGAVGAVLVFLLLFGAFRAPLKTVALGGANPDGLGTDLPRRDALIREIAELDERFQQGEVLQKEYQRQRQGLKSRILEASRPENDPEEGPSVSRPRADA